MKKLQNKKGFTLVEMIVVLAIIAILIALLAPNVARLIRNAQRTSDSAKAKTIMNGAMTYGTEAIADGNSVTAGTIVTGATQGEFGILLTGTATGDDAFQLVYYNDPANLGNVITGAPALMGGSGDDQLPSNTLTGQDQAYVYISAEGAVMGVVYCNGTNAGSMTIKAVAGVSPIGIAGANFSTADLRQKATINTATGVITVTP